VGDFGGRAFEPFVVAANQLDGTGLLWTREKIVQSGFQYAD
jgi:hypothetical protein